MTDGPRIGVVGYASLDSTSSVATFRGVEATSVLSGRMAAAEPSVGGIAHLTRATRAARAVTEAVSWVGEDSYGTRWTQVVAADGAGIDGVEVCGSRSPSTSLVHIGTGGTLCFFDPGDCYEGGLTVRQLAVLATSEWVVLSVGPADATVAVLQAIGPGTRLAWAVKRDEDAYPPQLLRALLARADVISSSSGERPWLSLDGDAPEHLARPGALVVQTRGEQGVSYALAGPGPVRPETVTVPIVHGVDPTGAGDTFIGTLVAELARSAGGSTDDGAAVRAAVNAAATAATNLLRARRSRADNTAPEEKLP